MTRASPSHGDAETSAREAALRQDLAAVREAEVSVMRSLQSELRRSAWTQLTPTIIFATPLRIQALDADTLAYGTGNLNWFEYTGESAVPLSYHCSP